jgi:hypothetical protein
MLPFFIGPSTKRDVAEHPPIGDDAVTASAAAHVGLVEHAILIYSCDAAQRRAARVFLARYSPVGTVTLVLMREIPTGRHARAA